MKTKINAGIIGGAGYTGGELIRLLLHHPDVNLSFVQSRSNAGNAVAAVHADLLGDTELLFTANHHDHVDVLFLCAGHGAARRFLTENKLPTHVKLVDLSQDFRLTDNAEIDGRQFIYGLPELNRDQIRVATYVANPGCFATAIQLGLLPLAKAGLLDTEVHTTGITGSTGAGQSLSATSHFSWRANNIQAYKTLEHQHLQEIRLSLQQLGAANPQIHFVPWRGDFARGIFVSSTITCTENADSLATLYESYYNQHPFTQISRQPVFMKQVVNTNKCIVQLERSGNKLVIHSAIDNLLKGASGQAVQNMNLMFGLEETTGLQLKATAF